jgi:long-subunit acyl-CoA synthetase (AMP-forming)/GNAT superfamily N-acetyltransferase
MIGSQAGHDLVERVQNALTAFDRGPAGAAQTAALVRAMREAIVALSEAKRGGGEAGTGRVQSHRLLVHRILEAAAGRHVRASVEESPFAGEWMELLVEAVLVSHYTVGCLFLARARALGDRTLFLDGLGAERVSWTQASDRVMTIGRALLAHRRTDRGSPVALIGSNSLDLALFDLACLVTGTPNVPIPANSAPAQVGFILHHSGAHSLFIGDDEVAEATRAAFRTHDRPANVYWLVDRTEGTDDIRPLSEFLAAGSTVTEEDVRNAALAVKATDVATTMYTSGTTGEPKGVPFTHSNLITKRFARAAAWPDVGEGDVFLCYLPLYHTFGRWLEMLGCVFWGSVYAFLRNVSVESMMQAFQRVRPTMFISVPKKWMQIAESVGPLEPGLEHEVDSKEIASQLREATGGRLRRGLSAAGYLPASAFHRFHAAGIELHSGFGMTEATGGITMTPSGDYRDDSIGIALPAIELKVAEDQELLIRGPYVTPPAAGDPPRADAWFATGDIVRVDRDGHLTIVDRKKEIFKNFQGETISPRRIETLFEDFEAVHRVLVIGDRRDYCTALIVPSHEIRDASPSSASVIDSPELREQFSSIVATVNRFLAPFERILDFALLTRDLSEDAGELTAKGTPKRTLVSERFRDVIELLYSREHATLSVSGLTVRIPHWFFRQIGLPSDSIQATETGIELASSGRTLSIARDGADVRVGDAIYDAGGTELLLGEIFGRAELWLGNAAVHDFARPGIEHWWRRGRRFRARTHLVRRVRRDTDDPSSTNLEAVSPTEIDIASLHRATTGLSAKELAERRRVVGCLRLATGRDPEIHALVRDVLMSVLADTELRAEALTALLPKLSPTELLEILDARWRDPSFLGGDENRVLAHQPLRSDHLDALIAYARDRATRGVTGAGRTLRFLVAQAVANRQSHLAVRSLLVELGDELSGPDRARIDDLLGRLVQGMRRRLPMLELASGVSWEDAIDLDDAIDPEDGRRIREGLRRTPLLAEAMALFGPNPSKMLRPLEAHSIRAKYLGTGTGRTVHLLDWRASGFDSDPPAFECIVKVNRSLTWEEIQRELRVLVRARTGASGRPVVKTHGGGYTDPQIWSEEYIPGRSLDVMIDQLTVGGDEEGAGPERLADLWQFIVSTTTALLVDFWTRTQRRLTLASPSPEKIVLPPHDWQMGGRIVSIADRLPCERLLDVLASARSGIVDPLRARFPEAELGPEWAILFSAALEILGETEGLALLEHELEGAERSEIDAACQRYVSSVRRRGFMPTRVRIAARRYRRWVQLNPRATLEARATTLDQIGDAYGLGELDTQRPGSRLQLFRHTVFRGSDEEFTRQFDDIIAKILRGESDRAQWHREVAMLKETFSPTVTEEFFLARMLYPHVDPRAKAVLVREEDARGGFETGIVVEQRDRTGRPFRIHRPANPHEISSLTRIFRNANLRRLPSPDRDELLIVTEEPDRVVGGIIYTRISETYVRLDWVVVSHHRRGRGIGRALVTEFLERLRAQGVQVVSTGFFRPAFFARFGFGVDPRYAGIVRILTPEGPGGETPAPEPTSPSRSDPGAAGR